VEGFESEWRDQNAIFSSIINKLLILLTGSIPSTPFDSPSLPPKLPPALDETAVALGPARGPMNDLLLSAT
jgi:hypothetical protein